MNGLIRRNNNDLDIFDQLFDGFFTSPVSRPVTRCMNTDIKENDNSYDLIIDVPGFAKEEIKISLENGYLSVEALHEEKKEEKQGHYLRRERFNGTAARSFYVGEDIAQEDIKAAFDKGVLTLSVPKQGSATKTKQYISIE